MRLRRTPRPSRRCRDRAPATSLCQVAACPSGQGLASAQSLGAPPRAFRIGLYWRHRPTGEGRRLPATFTLKEAEPSLWFRVGGRGLTEAPLSPSHLVNVVLAFVNGQPVEAPANVARLWALRVDYIRPPSPDARQEYYGGVMQNPVDMCGLIIYPTLGETLDHLAKAGDENHQVGRVVFVEISRKAH